MTDPSPGAAAPVGTPPVHGPEQAGPTVLRMLVGAQLRRLREAAGISTEAAGYEIRASHSKISRIELGRVGFKERDVADLLTLYGVTDPGLREPVLQLAEQANAPGWWQRYADVVPGWFEPYLGLEQGAEIIRMYDVQFVPALLQTDGYARALLRAARPEAGDDEIDRRVELRARRRRILERPGPARLWTVIDEAALRRTVGGPATMRAQIRHLLEAAEQPHVTVQILPFSSGGHAAECGAVTMLRFAEPTLPDVVYIEQLAGALYPDRTAEIIRYRDVLDRLGVQAEPPTATPGLLRRVLEET